MDEGHCIRNPASQLYNAVSSLISAHRLILTGTPVQNTPADLWALFNFLMPGYLSSRTNFNSRYAKPILACRNPKATDDQIREGEKALEKLHHQCLPFIIRRLKSEVLTELPDKIVQDYHCNLTQLQQKLYLSIVDRCSAKPSPNEVKNTLTPLHTLLTLRKLIDHPLMVFDVLQNLGLSAEVDLQNHTGVASSGKMMALRELLEECQISRKSMAITDNADEHSQVSDQIEQQFSPHRALIFCQWKATIDLVSNLINRGEFGPNISYMRLDGSVAPNERQTVVDKFNDDKSIDLLLLTTHIGGLGLNLTGADTVIFLDHDWNPFKDLQAADRAHRLGQLRTVNVYRLITSGTIEEKVMSLQKFKSDTANVLVGSDNKSITSMVTSDLMELLSLEKQCPDVVAQKHLPPQAKRAKKTEEASTSDTECCWSLSELWDTSSQYEEQFSSFLSTLKRVNNC